MLSTVYTVYGTRRSVYTRDVLYTCDFEMWRRQGKEQKKTRVSPTLTLTGFGATSFYVNPSTLLKYNR